MLLPNVKLHPSLPVVNGVCKFMDLRWWLLMATVLKSSCPFGKNKKKA